MASSSPMSGLRAAAARIGLPAWFIAVDLLWVAKPDVLGIDARHYQRAASAWLAGGDPWAVTESGITFAAAPHTLLFYVPTSVLAIEVSVALWLALGAAASFWLVRRLGLPNWWVLFPPLVHAVWNGNSQSVALALLVSGVPVAAVGAVGLKLYAAVPLLVRPRTLLAVGVVMAVTVPLLPWRLYVDAGFGVRDHIQTAWDGSAWRLPILLPPTLVALWILRRRGAEWLAIPAVWPATQFYYGAMALPAIVGRPFMAAALALPAPLIAPIVVMFVAGREVWLARRPTSAAAVDRAPLWLRRLIGPVR